MRITGAPDDLTSLVLVRWDGRVYTLESVPIVDGSALPLERRLLAKALRELADAVDANADAVGD